MIKSFVNNCVVLSLMSAPVYFLLASPKMVNYTGQAAGRYAIDKLSGDVTISVQVSYGGGEETSYVIEYSVPGKTINDPITVVAAENLSQKEMQDRSKSTVLSWRIKEYTFSVTEAEAKKLRDAIIRAVLVADGK